MEFEYLGIALIPVITALVSVAKSIGMPKDVAPALAILFGIGAGFLYVAPQSPQDALLAGLVMGLAAAGIHDVSEHMTERAAEVRAK